MEIIPDSSDIDMELCGNGTVDPGEACDDGNEDERDDCSAICRRLPTCDAPPCDPVCGDGVVVEAAGEACDDGNVTAGDGCNANCQVETGYVCSRSGPVALSDIHRDFNYSHPDFEQGVMGGSVIWEMVAEGLGDDGKPVFIGEDGFGDVTSAETFAEWYNSVSGENGTVISPLYLWNSAGGLVNQSGENGEQFTVIKRMRCGDDDENGGPCTGPNTMSCDEQADEMIDCIINDDGIHLGLFPDDYVDGNPVFFPVDHHPDAITPEPQYMTAELISGYDHSWTDMEWPETPHNFHFTSEIHLWFYYDQTRDYIYTLQNDDDAWVFINGHLVTDSGGIHTHRTDTYHLDETAAAELGIRDNGMVEIAIFLAERQTLSSPLLLRLSGFDLMKSRCLPES